MIYEQNIIYAQKLQKEPTIKEFSLQIMPPVKIFGS